MLSDWKKKKTKTNPTSTLAYPLLYLLDHHYILTKPKEFVT